jgi:phage head maturation protease
MSTARDYLADDPPLRRVTDCLGPVVLRDGGGEPIVEGLVVPFDLWQEIDNPREGHFLERFAPGSLKKSFGSGLLNRVKGFFEHGKSRMFERAPIMEIRETWEQADGAYFRAALLKGLPAWVEDGLRRGLYGASIGGRPVEVDVVRSPGKSSYNPRGLEERTYRELEAHDISLTSRPQYEAAVVALRSRHGAKNWWDLGYEAEPSWWLGTRDYLSEVDDYLL